MLILTNIKINKKIMNKEICDKFNSSLKYCNAIGHMRLTSVVRLTNLTEWFDCHVEIAEVSVVSGNPSTFKFGKMVFVIFLPQL